MSMAAKTTIGRKLLRTSLLVLVPAFLVMTLAVVGLNVWVSGRSQKESASLIEASLVAKGRVLTSNSAQALAGMAEQNAFLQIQSLVAGTVKEDPDVVSGLFAMADSTLPWAAAEDGGDTLGRLLDADTLRDSGVSWMRTRRTIGSRCVWNGVDSVIEFAAPVGSDPEFPAGWILYRLSTRFMRDAIEGEAARSRSALIQIILLLAILGGGSLAHSLWRFRRESERLSKPIQDLAASAEIIANGDYGKTVDVESDDEIGDLAIVLDAMRMTVQAHTEHLEDLVAAKMRQVRDILDNVEQGIFVLEFDGRISPEHSRSAPAILGVDRLETLADALHLIPSQMGDLLDWLRLVQSRSATMRWEKLVRIAPIQEIEIDRGDEDLRFVRFRYQKMFDSKGAVDKVMVLATDETEARRIEKIVVEEKERHENEVKTILGLVNNMPEAIHDFFLDVERRIGDLREILESMRRRSVLARESYPDGPFFLPTSDEIARIFRDLHTIKGNAGTYGFEVLSRIAHRSEDVLEDLKEPINVRTSNTLQTLLGLLGQMEAAYEGILQIEKRLAGAGTDGEVFVQIPERKIDHMNRLAKTLDGANASVVGDIEALRPLLQACRTLRNVPLSRLAEKYKALVQRLAKKLDKQVVFHCVPATLELDPHFFGAIDEALVHLLRNAVDHGIEAPGARLSAGKPEMGSIVLEIGVNEEQVTILLSDDGEGIDRVRLIEKAVKDGLLSQELAESITSEQALNLVLEAGFSMAREISEISGRGVGMSAVRECVEELGGRLTLTSRPREGTQVLIQLPGKYVPA